jgi:DNA-binding response OmpR family regulator
MHILLIDDDVVQLQMASVSLKFAGFKTTVADGGRKGLEIVEGNDFSAVLLDHDMPGMTGLLVLMEMARTGRLASTPVIYVTSRDDAAVIDRAFELGASGFVTKPVNWALMPHHIRFVVRAATNQRALQRPPEQSDR